MGEPANDTENPFLTSPSPAAVVITRNMFGGVHAGLLYKREGEARILHLATDNYVSNNWPWHRIWASPQIDPEFLTTIGAWCQRILAAYKGRHRNQLRFIYSYAYDQARFVERARNIALVLNEGTGLSCATFVLAIFNTVGVQLVDESTWPIRKDEDRDDVRGFMEHLLKEVPSDPEETATNRKLRGELIAEIEGGVRRIRPEEVLAACNCALPVRFEDCVGPGSTIRAALPPFARRGGLDEEPASTPSPGP